jgi:hypothetical protein
MIFNKNINNLYNTIINYFMPNNNYIYINNKNIIYTYTLYNILELVDNKPIYDEYIVIQKYNNNYIN